MASPASTFAWVGFILVNFGFAYLTTWGTSQHWIIGAVLCGVYALFLFGFGFHIEKNLKRIDADEYSIHENPIVAWEYKSRLALLIDLLFALGVVAVGVTGIIVSANVYCDSAPIYGVSHGDAGGNFGWITNSTRFPEDVKSWFHNTTTRTYGTWDEIYHPSFTFFPSTGNVLFSGEDQGHAAHNIMTLWKSSHDSAPEELEDMSNPTGFCGDNSTACFGAKTVAGMGYRMICTDDGETFRNSKVTVQWPQYLYWSSEGVLWFIAEPPNGRSHDAGVPYSVNPATMETKLHGLYKEKSDTDSSTDKAGADLCESPDKLARKQILTVFFISALPVLILSLVLFIIEGISSLTVTTYVGLSACVISLWTIFDPNTLNQFDFVLDINRYWFSWSTAVWLVSLCFLVITRRIKARTFSWGLNTSSVLYFTSMSILFFYSDPSLTNEWLRYVMINVLAYIPLAAIGVLYERNFLTFLGAGVGVLVDIVKLSSYLVGAMRHLAPEVILYFLLFSVLGVLLGVLGWELGKRQEEMQRNFFYWAEKQLISFMPPEEQLAMERGVGGETTPLRNKSFLSFT